MALFSDNLRSHLLYCIIEIHLLISFLCHRKLLHIASEYTLSRIRKRIHGMSHSIDETLVVKYLTIHHFSKVCSHLILVIPVLHMRTDVLHHLHHLDVGTAVLWSLKGGHGRRDSRVCICTCRCNHTGGKCGVVSTAVLHMKNKRHIKHPCFKLCVLIVSSEHTKEVFSCRKLWIRPVNIHALVIIIMIIRMITVHCKHREYRNK